MNILMIDELPIYIHGMKNELKRVMPECTFSATHSYEDAKEVLKSTPVSIVLLDGDMDYSGFIDELDVEWPTIPVVMMFRKACDRNFNLYQHHNIKGVVIKSLSAEKIMQVINVVLSGVICIPEQVIMHEATAKVNSPVLMLSQRQKEVLSLLANGGTNKQIGRELNISAGTVKVHLESIFHRLQVNNRTQAAKLYFKYINK
ncbi:response regulator transcription factor [Enterobacter bugandensis]|uniref:response regulator transcription factor n=2 Tax=Enterobacter bugandensis TaxID=881260 RepID=UPI000667123D|nr:response regulator transcription factor [Enterobacter bugandensis]MCK7238797.1 response regulator transcription factor [Enterobacter bugandensis]SAI57298.1 two component LuxR family transcriptional regulator [Enterobacter bugandensis]HBC7435551.1 response regulator transcription factor [Enterobacter bugandensis]HDV8501344.1 response regulator transcription factor [Enterobacter bugandensis]HEP0375208.1 response regulator transcription factor [Enterobacter bugandensis]